MENKQTAVEWFYQRILAKDIKSVYYQAKAMEKENMIELIRFMRTNDKMGKSLEDLYQEFKETYGK
jgi:hypothetical protein